MQVIYPNLEQPSSAWTPNTGPDINKQVPLALLPSSLPDGRLKLSNAGNVAFAGGLISRKLTPPTVPGFSLIYALLATKILVPLSALYNLARLETDLMLVLTPAPNSSTPIANRFNGSTQLNFDTGHFEIDASSGSAAWSDIGSGPGKAIAPDVVHDLAIRYQYDLVNGKISTLSITWDGTPYAVPANLQGVGCQTSNWTAVMSIQKQTEIYAPGSVEVVYDQTTLTLSDQPL